MNTADILRAARAMIDKPEKWGKGTYRDNPCAMDALRSAVEFSEDFGACRDALEKVLPSDYDTVAYYNDTHSHADVMALFDAAIALSAQIEEIPA